MCNEMKKILQWCEPFGGDGDISELEENISLMLDSLREEFEVSQPSRYNLEVAGIYFDTNMYKLSSKSGSVILSRVSALHPQEYKGDLEEFGYGIDGIGKRVETAVIEGENDCVEDVEIEVEASIGEFGAGFLKCSVEDFLKVASDAQNKGQNPLWFSDYVHCALRLEASKGAFMDPERYEALRLRLVDSISEGLKRGVVGEIRDMYAILKGKYTILKNKFDSLKDKH